MENEQLVARIRAGENELGNMLALWEQNKGFIAKTALRYSGHAELEDLKQEGYIALCEAVRHYNLDSGVPFINYAAFWLRQGMRRYIDNCGGTVRIPSHVRQDIQRYKRISGEYLKYYGHKPSDREMRAFLGVSEEKLKQIKNDAAIGRIRSLSEPVSGTEEDISLEDTVASGENLEEDVAAALDAERMKRELWLAVDSLPDNQPDVIRRRYAEGMTLKEAGESLGIGSEQVRNIQSKAIRTLRQRSHRSVYRRYFEEYITAAPVFHVGLSSFKTSWWSEVEVQAIGR